MSLFSAPHFRPQDSVSKVMLTTCLALLPGIAVYAWLIVPAILTQLLIASVAALASEAILLKIRGKPLAPFLTDGSALLTAWLIALTFPPLSPWWLIVTGTLFAIVITKQLYGGLGQNPFNPAMMAFAVCIIAFPALMSHWPSPGLKLSFADQNRIIFGLSPYLDSITSATPLDALKTALKNQGSIGVPELLQNREIYGQLAGRGWEWLSCAYLLGGLFLLQRRVISWHAPLAFIVSLAAVAGFLWWIDPSRYASPLFHLFAGGATIGAFFIVTDPVTGCTTIRGKLIFGALVGLLDYIIRVFGGYPDGVAFAIILMNIAAPLIDGLTQPAVFGMKGKSS